MSNITDLTNPSEASRLIDMAGDAVRGALNYRVSWPRPATPCELVPLWKGEFRDFGDWVNFATTRLTGTTDDTGREVRSICVDALGRRCSMGADFHRARDEDAFPVRYFWECVPATPKTASIDVLREAGQEFLDAFDAAEDEGGNYLRLQAIDAANAFRAALRLHNEGDGHGDR